MSAASHVAVLEPCGLAFAVQAILGAIDADDPEHIGCGVGWIGRLFDQNLNTAYGTGINASPLSALQWSALQWSGPLMVVLLGSLNRGRR